MKVFSATFKLILLIIFTAIILSPLYFYFLEFGTLSGHSWKNNQSWANFGSFISGTIGPILSGVACIAVYLTYKSQQLQIALFKQQTKIDEIQRLIATTTDKIDSILFTTPFVYTQSAETLKITDEDFERLKNTIFRDLLQALGTRELENEKDPNLNKYIDATKAIVKFSVNHLNIELNQLGRLLLTYRKLNGGVEIEKFYLEKYEPIVGYLYSTQQLYAPSLEKLYDLNSVVQNLQIKINNTLYK